MVLEPPDVIEEEDLTDSDGAILDALSDGRLTKGAIVDRTDLHRNTVRNRLDVLIAADAVDVVHKGTRLYELVDDPRDDAGEEDDDEELKRHVRAAGEAIDNDDPDELCRHVRAACEVIPDE